MITKTARWTLVVAALLVSGCETDPGAVEATAVSLHDSYFNKCSSCHTPDAPGKTAQTEQNLDFSTAETMQASLKLKAKGLVGNQAGCNDVPFVEAGNAAGSLLVAVLDEATRQAFDNSKYPSCDGTAISAMDNRVGGAPDAATLAALKQWINDGAN